MTAALRSLYCATLFGLGSALAGCGADAPAPSGPIDGGLAAPGPTGPAHPLDAGQPALDAGAPRDAGRTRDAEVDRDAGAPDAAPPDAAPSAPVDCAGIVAGGWQLCAETPRTCEAVFEDGAGCAAVCAAAGLDCVRGLENLDGQCAPDPNRSELGCGATGHQSDYCVCASAGCEPQCGNRACGDDGCGGSCGDCGPAGNCNPAGQCECEPRTCDEALIQCGAGHDDGCGGTLDCGGCPAGLACDQGWCGFAPTPCAPGACPAFPGAEGEGMDARGGRGGDVYHVTSLADSGPGTLRAGVAGSGARTVVFDVAGLIDLRSPLQIRRSRLTLAGQTAPGDGITIRGYQVDVRANDVIIQHLRFRAGDVRKKTRTRDGFTEDSLTVSGDDIIIDHVSASWGIDENLSGGSEFSDVTVQWSIVAEGLKRTRLFHGEYDADHPGHSMGSLFKPSVDDGDVSIHHNLFAHNNNRNPAVGTYETDQRMRADIRNNVIYDCPSMGYTSGASDRVEVNYVGNYGIWGPDSSSSSLFRGNGANDLRLYQADNLRDRRADNRILGTNDGWAMFSGDYARRSSPFTFKPVTTQPPQVAVELVLTQAGARPWSRDAVDQRIAADVRNGTGGLVDSQSEVGGWGPLAPGTPEPDRDRDGLPDEFERRYGTNPSVADHNGDLSGDGRTNLEAYLAWAARAR